MREPVTPEMVQMAKVGLNALIDEATGYQQVRPKDDLRQQARRLGVVSKGELPVGNEAAERLRLWAEHHAMLRDHGSIPSDALEVLAVLGAVHEATVERIRAAFDSRKGVISLQGAGLDQLVLAILEAEAAR